MHGLKVAAKRPTLIGINKNNARDFLSGDEYVTEEVKREWLKKVVIEFFEHLHQIPHWSAMINGHIPAVDVREQFVIAHSVFLEALGMMGNNYLRQFEKGAEVDWSHFSQLENLDVTRSSAQWEGRCVLLGKMNKTVDGVRGTASALCELVGLKRDIEMERFESRLQDVSVV